MKKSEQSEKEEKKTEKSEKEEKDGQKLEETSVEKSSESSEVICVSDLIYEPRTPVSMFR